MWTYLFGGYYSTHRRRFGESPQDCQTSDRVLYSKLGCNRPEDGDDFLYSLCPQQRLARSWA